MNGETSKIARRESQISRTKDRNERRRQKKLNAQGILVSDVSDIGENDEFDEDDYS